MKGDKKKTRELRKERKQKRNKPQQPFAIWLTKDLNKLIWKVAEQMTNERKYPRNIINKSFLCKEENKKRGIKFSKLKLNPP